MDIIFALFCIVLPLLLFGFLVFSNSTKPADADTHQPTASRLLPVPADPLIEERFAAIDSDRLLTDYDATVAPTPSVMSSPRPKSLITRDMRKQAQADYDTARGTAHLRLLRAAQAVLQPQLAQTERSLQS